jgi:hypothetical protein
MILRNECVICLGELQFTFKRENYPITANPPNTSHSQDIYNHQSFFTCVKCSCVQMGNLIEPALLYEGNHNNTYNTPTWKAHHLDFCNFIMKTNIQNILEIGGNGLLFKLMNTPCEKYSCLNICDPIEKLEGVQYYQGNCEDFHYPKGVAIVMSHVFEHLFNPRLFIERIDSSEIESLYISIPNMKRMVELNTPNIIHNEHTYYVDSVNLEWLFSQYNYELCEVDEFKEHSLFFHFRRNTQVRRQILQDRPEIAKSMCFQIENMNFKSIDIKPNSFIIPAGLYGQILYYYKQPNILGFIDNDKTKQNHRVYGTPHYVYDFNILLKHDKATIYLLAGPYNSEIKKQIQILNTNVEIIEL